MPQSPALFRARMFHMKEFGRDTIKAFVPILLSALAAGAFTFVQSLAASAGACPAPSVSIGETGLIGGAIKAGHTAWHMLQYGRIG